MARVRWLVAHHRDCADRRGCVSWPRHEDGGRAASARNTIRRVSRALRAAAAVVMLVTVACRPAGPRPIALNEDACNYCRMTISDARFGGEVVTRTGKVFTFDSVECLASWVRAADAATIAGIYVIDLQHPGSFVDATGAGFLRDAVVMTSPMGRSVLAFASPEIAEQQRSMLGGTVVTWPDLAASLAVPKEAKP